MCSAYFSRLKSIVIWDSLLFYSSWLHWMITFCCSATFRIMHNSVDLLNACVLNLSFIQCIYQRLVVQKTATSKDMRVTASPDKTLISVTDIKFAQWWNLILCPYTREQWFYHFCTSASQSVEHHWSCSFTKGQKASPHCKTRINSVKVMAKLLAPEVHSEMQSINVITVNHGYSLLCK